MTSPFLALTSANAKETSRDRVSMLFSFAFPLVILLVFGLLYHGQSFAGHAYIETIAPGVLSWAIASSAMFGVAYAIVGARTSDLLRLVRMTPVSLRTVLGALLVVTLGSAAVQAVFFVLVATVPFLGLHVASSAGLAVLPLLAGIATFFGVGIVIGSLARKPEAVTAIGNVFVLPMVFLSGTVYPISAMPRWLQYATEVLPLRHMIAGTNAALTGTQPASHALLATGVLVGFALLAAGAAVTVFRWSAEA